MARLFVVALTLATLTTGAAADRATAFDLWTFRPATAGTDSFITVERPFVLAKGGLAFGALVDYAKNPLTAHRAGDMVIDAPVSDRTAMTLVGSYGLFGMAEATLVLPIYMQSGAAQATGLTAASGTVLGDLEVRGRVRLFQRPKFAIATSLDLTLPTGDDTQYAGADGVTVHGRAIFGLHPGALRLAANVGLRLRTQPAELGAIEQAHELTYGVGASVRLAKSLDAIVELYGAQGLVSQPSAVSPLETAVGLRWFFARRMAVTVGGGTGLSSGVGAPDMRVFLAIAWAPDGEKVTPIFTGSGGRGGRDKTKCPGGPDCPDPLDPDGDQVADDKCPDKAEDKDKFQDEDGCPDLDNDGDKVADAQDRCPGGAEDEDGYKDDDGCPEPDNDRDGIEDLFDDCMDKPETINGKSDDDGCPDEGLPAVTVEGETLKLWEAVTFGKDGKLTAHAQGVLKQVAATLRAYTDIRKVRIEAHVHPTANSAKDQTLTEKRVDAVKKFLVANGIDAERIEVKAWGSLKPLGKTKAANERIEIHIVDRDIAEDGIAVPEED